MSNYITAVTLNDAIKKTSVAVKNYVDGKFQPLQDERLETTNKTIVGAINELKNGSSIQGGVFNAETHYDFPSVGSVNVIYKAYKERKTYQWNAEKLIYESLDEDVANITVINGGSANGTA